MTHDDITKMLNFVCRVANKDHASWGTADRDVEAEFDEIVDEARKLMRRKDGSGQPTNLSNDCRRSLQ